MVRDKGSGMFHRPLAIAEELLTTSIVGWMKVSLIKTAASG